MNIVFFSLESGRMGGVAAVNKTLGKILSARGHEISYLYLRCGGSEEEVTLNPNHPWEFTEGQKIKEAVKKKKFSSAARLAFLRFRDSLRYERDLFRAREYLMKKKPDLIVASHYLLLGGIPEALLGRAVYHIHRATEEILAQKAHRNALMEFNGKLRFLFLSRAAAQKAEGEGLKNCHYIYNPLSHYPEQRTAAEEKKTVSVITRFSAEKRLPLAVDLLKKAMDSLHDKNEFSVHFWGDGEDRDALLSAIDGDGRFQVMGRTNTPFAVLENSRFTVNTSPFEGFSISVLEAVAAGVPTVAFHFGAAAEEEIQNGKTGFLIPQGDEEGFVSALLKLFTEDETVREMSLQGRDFARAFSGDTVGNAWEDFLSLGPLDKSEKKD